MCACVNNNIINVAPIACTNKLNGGEGTHPENVHSGVVGDGDGGGGEEGGAFQMDG